MKYGAVIVAAGISSRMGKFKPMLQVGNETIIGRTVRMMKAAKADPIVVVTGYRREIIEENLKNEGVMFFYNERYAKTQMFDSILLGLKALEGKCDRVLISPGDVPLVQQTTVKNILEEEGQFVRPVYGEDAGHPIVIDANIIPLLENYQGDGGLRKAIKSLDIEVKDIPVDDQGITMDVDTKEDYGKLLRQNMLLSGGKGDLRLELQITVGTDEIFFGAGTAQFMELIALTGSMNAACQAMHMSYTKGWKMINMLEKKLGYKVLERVAGGTEGGGSCLTDKGSQFLMAYNRMQKELEEVGENIFQKYFDKISD